MIDKSYTVPNYWSNIQYTNNMTRGVYNIYIMHDVYIMRTCIMDYGASGTYLI